MVFCDTIEKYQKILRTSGGIPLKRESAKPNAVVIHETILKDESEFIINDEDLINPLFEDENDEDLDSPASDDESMTSALSVNCINLRKKVPPPIRPLSIFLERLEIAFVKSDTESDSETEDEQEILKSVKRPRPSGSAEKSPNAKRMRISPIKPNIVSFLEFHRQIIQKIFCRNEKN